MPRVKLGERDDTLSRIIKANMARYGIPHERLEKALRISTSTHFKRMREPDSMSVKELKGYIRLLHISDEDILQALKGGDR